MQRRIPIGIDDFRRLRELGLEYVDKSHLIRELLDDLGVTVTLLPRPRRFGKSRALLDLSRLLRRRHGYARQALVFYRTFLGEGLKDNPHLFKGVLTGILRIARESIFSGLDNLAVYTLLRPEMSTCFGFDPQPRGAGRLREDLPALDGGPAPGGGRAGGEEGPGAAKKPRARRRKR
jgi:hypothetical protein